MRLPPASLLAALLSLSQCKHHNPTPVAQLPAATQTGADTFGCLVNGQPYTPAGNTGSSNLYVDPTWRDGNFNLTTYRIAGSRRQYLTINAFSVKAVGSYSFALVNGVEEVFYSDLDTNSNLPPPCATMYDSRDVTYRKGRLQINRFNTSAGIIAGTFEVTVARTGCDTLKLTQGRFDVRF
jgi:hypothetical protein